MFINIRMMIYRDLYTVFKYLILFHTFNQLHTYFANSPSLVLIQLDFDDEEDRYAFISALACLLSIRLPSSMLRFSDLRYGNKLSRSLWPHLSRIQDSCAFLF